MVKPFPYLPVPAVIQIETTTLCNASCPFCPQKKVNRAVRSMSESLFRKIADETRGMGILYRPFLLNEPLADPRISDFIRYLNQDATARVDLDTNAGLLSKETAEELLNCVIEEIRFSIDGFTEATCKARRGLDRKKVYDNVEHFVSRARSQGAKTRFVARMIHIPGKEEEEQAYRDYWSQRVDEVSITEEYRYPWQGQKKSLLLPCLKIREQLFFQADGRAPLCCWDTQSRSCVGDANREKVLGIWNGAAMAQHRQLLDAGRRDRIPLCSRCDAYAKYDFKAQGFAGPATDEEIREK